MHKAKLFWLYWFPLIVYAAIIFAQSAFPSPDGLPSFPFSDKLEHFGAYAVMGALFLRAFKKSYPRWSAARIVVFSVLCTVLYGAGDEFHQSFVPERMADPMDLAADFFGGVIGAFCYYYVLLKLGWKSASN